MDKKGKKILYELDKNSRNSYSKIGRKTHVSKETVRYRINSMLKKGIIQKFLTIMNTPKLGISHYQIMLKLQNVDEEKREQIITFLKKSDKISWIGNLEGNYDLAFILYVKNQIELQNTMNKLYEKFSKFIMRKTLSINLSAEFFSRGYLIGNERKKLEKTAYESHNKTVELDKTDSKICSLLGEDARISSVEMEEKIGVSSDTILQRLKKLREEKIILGYGVVLNQKMMNQFHYKILLHLNNISKEKEKKMISFIRHNKNTIALIKTLADWDYEIDIEIGSAEKLKTFTMDLTNKFSDIIRDYDILRIIDMPKYTFYPLTF